MKFVLELVAILLSVHQTLEYCGRLSPHYYVEGDDERYDPLVYKGYVTLDAFPNHTYNFTLSWPTVENYQNDVISRIVVEDLLKNGYNGCITNEGGGVGFLYVDLGIESQFGGPIAFSIDIYSADVS